MLVCSHSSSTAVRLEPAAIGARAAAPPVPHPRAPPPQASYTYWAWLTTWSQTSAKLWSSMTKTNVHCVRKAFGSRRWSRWLPQALKLAESGGKWVVIMSEGL